MPRLVKTLTVTARYDLGGKGSGPAGLGLDEKNHIRFAVCREPEVAVVLCADAGKILATVPLGHGTDGGGFNPTTMEAFSSQGDGTLTFLPRLQSKHGCRTLTENRKLPSGVVGLLYTLNFSCNILTLRLL